MLGWALLFFVFVIVSAVFAFGGIAGATAGIAQFLFSVFLVLMVASLVMHFGRGGGFAEDDRSERDAL